MGIGGPLLQSPLNPLPSGSSAAGNAPGGPPLIGSLAESQSTGSQPNQGQSTSPHSYYGGPTDQQLANSSNSGNGPTNGDQQLASAGPMGTTAISPHLQQNGYGTSVTSANVTGNGQLQNYSQQQQQQQSHNGGQGTWAGPNTLTYTQSMQPPDSRTSHNAYCKCWCANEDYIAFLSNTKRQMSICFYSHFVEFCFSVFVRSYL